MSNDERQKQRVEAFFAAYEERFNRALGDEAQLDVEGTAGAFASFFVEAGPSGVNGGKNDEQFRRMIPQGMAFYRSIGTQRMKVAGLTVTPLDGGHAMAKVHWDSRYRKPDGRELAIEFDVIYLLQTLGERPEIFAYITGDEQKVLREHGLLPA